MPDAGVNWQLHHDGRVLHETDGRQGICTSSRVIYMLYTHCLMNLEILTVLIVLNGS